MSKPRTSKSHPLQIAEVEVPGCDGLIGITFCPGKKQPNAQTGAWDRDIPTDVDFIKQWGANVVLPLLENHEFDQLKVIGLRDEVVRNGMGWIQLAIQDQGVPDGIFESRWEELGPLIRNVIRTGGKVLIHCKGGLGRSGTIAARLLVEFGQDSDIAISKVREARPGAIENAVQENYVKSCEPLSQSRCTTVDSTGQNPPESYEMLNHKRSSHVKEDQFRGCMLGGAVGDALGGPVEFMTLAAIKAKFGADGITEFAPAYGKTGAVTDDTQMTLFTAEGVIRYWHGGAERSIQAHFEDVLRHSYLRWLTTQGMATKNSGLAAQMQSIDEGWLLTIPELHHQRAPGTTCLNALIQGESIVGSKGCGGVMRVAPVGLLLSGLVPDDEIFDYGCQAAKITHGHPAGYLSGGFLAVVISQILKGKDLIEAVDEATKILIYRKDHQEVLEAVQAAVKLASSNPCTSRGIESLGEGWVAEEALAMGIYSSLMAEDFRHGIILAVNHGGDSDSTGSIAGQVLGAIHGVTAIPDDWLNSLELRDTIDVIGRDLYSVNESPFVLSHSLVHRYPPN